MGLPSDRKQSPELWVPQVSAEILGAAILHLNGRFHDVLLVRHGKDKGARAEIIGSLFDQIGENAIAAFERYLAFMSLYGQPADELARTDDLYGTAMRKTVATVPLKYGKSFSKVAFRNHLRATHLGLGGADQ